ncbi:MAG: AAA family ATPase [Nitrospira sp.]|nr:AAA family ATPase [Nitrospira sp.]
MKTPEELQDIYQYLDRLALDHPLLKRVAAWYQRWREKEAARQAKGTVVTIPFSQIKLESVGWAWDRRIPTKMLTGVIGDPEQGKSTFLAWLAAQASQGQLAGEYAGKPVGVCVCSAEDSPASVIGPRLTIAGADMDRVYLMEFRDENNLARGVRFPDDGVAIRTRMEATGSKLLLVDPLVAHLPTELNSWRDQDIRVALSAMARLAEELGAAVIFLCHLNKNSNVPNPLYRIGSSIGIPAAARSILWAAPDPLDPTNEYAHVLLHLKCNVAEKAPTLRYGTESHVLSGGIKTSQILWAGEAPAIKADDLMQPPHENQKHLSALAEAKQWLEGVVGAGGREAAFILKEAVKVGISERTLNRAKKDLGIKPQFNGKDHLWMWVLPAKEEGPSGQDPVSQTSGNLALSHKKTINNINHIEQGCQAAKMAKVDSDGNLVGSLASDPTNPEGPMP